MWVIHTWILGASDPGWPHTWAAGMQVDAGPELSSASSVQGRSWEGWREGVGQGVSPGPMPLGQLLVAYTWLQGHPQTFLLSPGLPTDLCVMGDSKRASLQEFKVMTNRGNHGEFQEDPARKNQEVKLKSQVSDLYGPQISTSQTSLFTRRITTQWSLARPVNPTSKIYLDSIRPWCGHSNLHLHWLPVTASQP